MVIINSSINDFTGDIDCQCVRTCSFLNIRRDPISTYGSHIFVLAEGYFFIIDMFISKQATKENYKPTLTQTIMRRKIWLVLISLITFTTIGYLLFLSRWLVARNWEKSKTDPSAKCTFI